MIEAVLLEGATLDSAQSIGSMKFPVLPRVGDYITLPIEQRFVVKAINHHKVNLQAEVEIFILVHDLKAGTYDIKALIG